MVARVRGDVERPGHPVGPGARRSVEIADRVDARSWRPLRPGAWGPCGPGARKALRSRGTGVSLGSGRARRTGRPGRTRGTCEILQGRLVPERPRDPEARRAHGRSTRPPSPPGDSARRSRRPAGSRFPSGRRRSGPASRCRRPRRPWTSREQSPPQARYPACVRARILLSSLTRLVVARLRGAGQMAETDSCPQSRMALRRCGCIDADL